MSGVQVLPDGNPRQGGMNADELTQCIHDIVNWFQRKTKLQEFREKRSDLESLEQALDIEIPEDLGSLLLQQSGGLWFDEYQSLNADDILSTSESFRKVKGWKSNYIPFAMDVDGSVLICDVSAQEAVFEFGETGKGKKLALTLANYLEDYRNRLLSGQFTFVEDVGLVENTRK